MAAKSRNVRKPRPPRRRNDRPLGAGVGMDWRTIEAALVEIAKTYKLHIDNPTISGDSIMWLPDQEMNDSFDSFNLTEIAKELAERLGSKA